MFELKKILILLTYSIIFILYNNTNVSSVRAQTYGILTMKTQSEAEQFKHLIEPFAIGEGSIGCLLVHGYTGSPSEMRPLGEFLAQQGYAVTCPLLPGHGTTPEDLERCSCRDWFDAVVNEYQRMRTTHLKLFVIGLSMGGVLSLHLAAHYPIDGVVTMGSGTRLTDWRIRLLPFLRHFLQKIRKTHNDYARGPNRIRFAYDYNSVNPTRELLRLQRHVEDDLPDVIAPLLLIHSKNDIIIKFKNAELIRSLVRSKDVTIVPLENSRHVVTLSEDKETIHSAVKTFISQHISVQ